MAAAIPGATVDRRTGQGQPTPQPPPGLNAAGPAAATVHQPGASSHQAPPAEAKAGVQARQPPPADGSANA
eukprot:11298020-Alexandrium_andersonii.AAC.1